MRFYDENVFYHWTFKEWNNRITGALLQQVDDREAMVHAAYISGIVSQEKKPKAINKYFDSQQARREILNSNSKTKEKNKPNFTFYNKAVEGIKKFDWSKAYSPGE